MPLRTGRGWTITARVRAISGEALRSRVVAWGDLGADLVLAPERHLARAAGAAGPRLGDLVTIAAERVEPAVIAREEMIVIDTTHAKDGLLDVRSAARARTLEWKRRSRASTTPSRSSRRSSA
jgi:hypothetical protein